ncbi:beta-N-acetylhexosaminidase [Flavobacterium hibernum]|uniref:Beta-N-acetylhexosaminidase n=1 Tax=Flavobacterium hibernum TaxID=37752 RepID=A0A0D0EKN0_9FLAO|nr:family 20 glycosylhydrolase [Flavobacterium hibernum]KIO52065.1 beta-N-acetylhexosaminidase [Flavobacterium hibernum]OXA84106.1 beta-N-acetylhexosaminidase [Flavobacterium hibernum]STO11081.1 Beta-hexosaminidase [Flavobacterium hibernum]
MKYLLVLLLAGVTSSAQIKKEQLNLMPWPQNVVLNDGNFALNKNFKVNITGNPNPRIFGAVTRFLRRLDGRTGIFFEQGFITKLNEVPTAELQINCTKSGKIGLYEDESYHLDIKQNKITINATSDLGALHGLETLLQMLQNNSTSFYFPTSQISDFPRFTWRGLMIDVSRHFQPVDVIKRNLDALAAMKMNVFHWHLVDDQGWRIEMKKHPKLIELASDGMYYTQEEIKNIVKYADERGILVVPEIDVPGHGSAILTAYPEIGSKVITLTGGTSEKNIQGTAIATYGIERNAGIFSPTLDPSNPKTYQLLSEIFDEVCPLFPGAYFHIGGDENEGKDWDSNPKIQEFKKKNKLATNHELQTYFTMQLVPMLKKHGKQLMGWEEILTKNMSKDAIIHAWRGANEGVVAGQSLVDAVKKGYKTVQSNGFYVDLLYPVESHYLNDPMPKGVELTAEEKARVLGGEATMWTELVTPTTIDSRLWPRTAAIAERLWSAEDVTDMASMRKRLETVSFRLEELGLTHIRNKGVILRNIANNQNTESLNEFSNVCEPLKGYKRNIGGTEYQMYSPFTLFADACTSDSKDSLAFDEAVSQYLGNKSPENKAKVAAFFNKWITVYKNLGELSVNAPLVQPVLPLAKKLNDASQELLLVLDNKSTLKTDDLKKLIELCDSKDHADVELGVYKSLKKLM